MGDENPIHTLGDYSKPSHEGYRNTIELHVRNNVVPLQSDTIRTAKLCNDILMFQQHHGESLSEAWTRFKDLLQKVPHHSIDLWLQIQIFYDHVNPITRQTINQSAGGKLRELNPEESWAILEDLALYDNESWNDPRDFAKPIKAIALPQDVPSTSDRRLIELENEVQCLMEAYLAQPVRVNELSLPKLTPTRMTLELADRSITRPKGVAEDVFVKVRKFHFPTDFVVVDFEADPRVPLILGRSFLRSDRALIDIYGEEITLRVNDESVTFNLNQTMRYSSIYDDNWVNRIDVIDIAYKSIPTGIENSCYDPEGDILYLEKLLNDDPSQLPPMNLKPAEETKAKSLIEEPPELELKELPSHLEYAFLKETDKLPVIIAKDLKDDEKRLS
nr:reverse transcriptase domain-containing protein [Tanacetum cinerariifolium]